LILTLYTLKIETNKRENVERPNSCVSEIEMKRGNLVIIKSPVYGGTDKIASFAIGVKSDDSRVISI